MKSSVILRQVADEHGVTVDLIKSKSRKHHVSRARAEACWRLNQETDLKQSIAANLLNISRMAYWKGVQAHERRMNAATQDQTYIIELEDRLRRLSGCDLSYKLSDELGLVHPSALLLAILVENYPKVLTRPQFCELFDTATQQLDLAYGGDGFVAEENVRYYVSKARKRFQEMGLPDPIRRINPGGMILSDDIAPWLQNKFGAPEIIGKAA